MNETRRLLIGAGTAPGAVAALGRCRGRRDAQLLGDAQPKHGGSVVYGIESDIPSLDPHITFGGSNKRVVMSVFEGLVERDRGNVDPEGSPSRPEIVPVLAESWEVLDDGKRYRFKLRSGVTFHDGNAVQRRGGRVQFPPGDRSGVRALLRACVRAAEPRRCATW